MCIFEDLKLRKEEEYVQEGYSYIYGCYNPFNAIKSDKVRPSTWQAPD